MVILICWGLAVPPFSSAKSRAPGKFLLHKLFIIGEENHHQHNFWGLQRELLGVTKGPEFKQRQLHKEYLKILLSFTVI